MNDTLSRGVSEDKKQSETFSALDRIANKLDILSDKLSPIATSAPVKIEKPVESTTELLRQIQRIENKLNDMMDSITL